MCLSTVSQCVNHYAPSLASHVLGHARHALVHVHPELMLHIGRVPQFAQRLLMHKPNDPPLALHDLRCAQRPFVYSQ